MLKHTLLVICLSLLVSTESFGQSNHELPCDTLITTEGKTYIAEILLHNAQEVRFSPCNDALNTVYSIPTARLKGINGKKYSAPQKPAPKTKPPALKHKPVPFDTTHNPIFLTLDCVQAVKKEILLSGEFNVFKHISLTADAGMRWHNYSPTGLLQYDYTETIKYDLLEKKASTIGKPEGLGDFIPFSTASIGAGIQFYKNSALKSGLYITPGCALLYHKGYLVKDTKTVTASFSSSDDDGWLSFSGTTTNKLHLDRQITQQATRSIFQKSLAIGYRFVASDKHVLELGFVFGNNKGKTNNALNYYGLSDNFFRVNFSVGTRIY